MPTKAAPIATIRRPVAHGRNPAQRPNAYPHTNNIAIATALDKRSANRASSIRMNGMTIGKVDTKLSKQRVRQRHPKPGATCFRIASMTWAL